MLDKSYRPIDRTIIHATEEIEKKRVIDRAKMYTKEHIEDFIEYARGLYCKFYSTMREDEIRNDITALAVPIGQSEEIVCSVRYNYDRYIEQYGLEEAELLKRRAIGILACLRDRRNVLQRNSSRPATFEELADYVEKHTKK